MAHTDYVESPHHKHLPVFLLVAYLMFWAFFAYQPLDRFDWLLENVLVFIFVPALLLTYKNFRLSNISYICIFLFMMLHTIGAHYTYSEVPIGYWLQEIFGGTRNHFDRIVHFSFGLLLAYPVREVFHRIASAKGFWSYWLPFELTLACSAIYEILEWLAAVSFGSGASAFLGTQGDEFDAIKDMALAGVGALIAMLITLGFNLKYNKNVGKEMEESLEVKEKEPMGEVKLSEMEHEKKRGLAAKFADFKKKYSAKKEETKQETSEDSEGIPEDNIEDLSKHDHSPEEIMRLLEGENIHKGGKGLKRKNSAKRKPGRAAKKKK